MSVRHFVDMEAEYRAWVKENPQGYVLNTNRVPSASYLILHRADCWTITGEPTRGEYWTKDFSKVCGDSIAEIQDWAERGVGGSLQACRLCNPT